MLMASFAQCGEEILIAVRWKVEVKERSYVSSVMVKVILQRNVQIICEKLEEKYAVMVVAAWDT